ncbi:ribonuclease P protein subunit p30-like [Haliotis rufescens]|uniref:ribonuclease P protein subunit p30-like n=1 Tax=Haliotis rufescens TaxID=6454 RepID=UPI001EAFA707|nr:ribonuclease P protein subunit p30-like [Haliotis rufescens]
MAAFSDLCLTAEDETTKDALTMAIKLGYECVGLNVLLKDLKGKGASQTTIPTPRKYELRKSDLQFLKKKRRSMEQFSRLTATIEDPSQTHKLGSPEVQAYDLVAVEPTSEKTFHMACAVLNVDIISVDMTEKVPYFFKKPSINMAFERGIHFEIKYSPTVRDSTLRRNVISSAISLAEITKGKNIILSSGCEMAMELRGPYDVINLGLMFGLNHENAKNAVAKNCRAVLKHAESRKISKSVISVSKLPVSGNMWTMDKYGCSVLAEDDGTEDEPKKKKRKKKKGKNK